MKLIIILSFFCLPLFSQVNTTPKKPNSNLKSYIKNHSDNGIKSTSTGSVSNGSLKNGKLVPFSGPNFFYFDETSYLSSRAFLNNKVLNSVLEGYQQLNQNHPGRLFRIMECSHENGGKLWPHKTHQNGLSVDFMMPKIKNTLPYYGLDSLGTQHYWLSFNNQGQYQKDTSISIDFELIAEHLLILQKKAKKQNLKVAKVIIKIEMKDELFKGKFGKQLKESGIYIVKSLSPAINALHDEHYHVDFKEI